jgi:hypothetical protein
MRNSRARARNVMLEKVTLDRPLRIISVRVQRSVPRNPAEIASSTPATSGLSRR